MQITIPALRGIYFCAPGDQWILPYKTSYIFTKSPRSLDTYEEKKYEKILESRRFEVRGSLSYIPGIVNIGVNLQTRDLHSDCLLWIHLYFGPYKFFSPFANPSGNMESPY